MAQLDAPDSRSVQFLFPVCQARVEGDALVVSVPGGTAPCGDDVLSGDLHVELEPGPRRRLDAAEFPTQPAYAGRCVRVHFRGAAAYGAVNGVLLVQGLVRSAPGLPRGAVLQIDAAPLLTAQKGAGVAGGPVNGPHLPFP